VNINQNIGFIIQARTGSLRFPNKVIKKFYKGESLLEILIKKLRNFNNIPIIIATTKNSDDDIIIKTAMNQGVKYYRGSENNVLKRFIDAAQKFHIDHIIRICSDNVFLDTDGIEEIIFKYQNNPVDYLSYILSDNRPAIKTHFGFWAEIVSLMALLKIAKITNKKTYLEHVTNYIYEHPEEFKISFIKAPEIVYYRNDIRLTVDTEEDFILQQSIYQNLIIENKVISIREITDYLDRNKSIIEKMIHLINLNRK
jgi:spore coat polysaccharide biosynthesis protein SpsF